jgi:Protein of unknown function (DUF2721)
VRLGSKIGGGSRGYQQALPPLWADADLVGQNLAACKITFRGRPSKDWYDVKRTNDEPIVCCYIASCRTRIRLGAMASFLSVLASHVSRIIDRARAIAAVAADDPAKASFAATLPQLTYRANLVYRSIYWAVASGICCCFLMITAFAAAYFGLKHEPIAAILFVVTLVMFTFSHYLCSRGKGWHEIH